MCQLGPDPSYVPIWSQVLWYCVNLVLDGWKILSLIIQGRIILTQYQKVRDQIGNLPIILFDEYIEQKIIADEIYIHTHI